jgi:hypothetical protein
LAASNGVNFSGNVSRQAAAILSPATGQTVSFTDSAALRLRSANTSGQTVNLNMEAYDANSHRVDVEIWSGQSTLRSGEATITTVVLPLGNTNSANYTVCAVQTAISGSRIARACGSYRIERKFLSE